MNPFPLRLAAAGALQDLLGYSPFEAGRAAGAMDREAQGELHQAAKNACRLQARQLAAAAVLRWEMRRGVTP